MDALEDPGVEGNKKVAAELSTPLHSLSDFEWILPADDDSLRQSNKATTKRMHNEMAEGQRCSDIRARFPKLAEDEEELPDAFFKSLPSDAITCLSNKEDLVLQHVTPNEEVRASGPLVVG